MSRKFYIVRSSWDTGYEDFDYENIIFALARRKSEIDKIVTDTKLTYDEARKFVVLYEANEVEI
jgi:hypothetical protein